MRLRVVVSFGFELIRCLGVLGLQGRPQETDEFARYGGHDLALRLSTLAESPVSGTQSLLCTICNRESSTPEATTP